MSAHIKTVSAFWMLVLFLSVVGLQAAPAPRLVVDESVYFFGERSNTESVEHTFRLRNEGNVSLEIRNIRSSCGCTIGRVSRKTLEPGESSEITATLDLRGRRGPQHMVLTVETNDPQLPFAQLQMRGTAIQEIQVQPSSLFAADLAPGRSGEWTVSITGQPGNPFTIKRIERSAPWIHAQPPRKIQPHEYALSVRAEAPKEPGAHQGHVRVHTDHPRFPLLHIPINIHASGMISVAPQRITLMAGNDMPVTRYVVLRSGEAGDFDVLDVIPPHDDIHVNVLRIPGQGYRLQLSNVRASPELADAVLRIQTNLEDTPMVEIPFEIIQPEE